MTPASSQSAWRDTTAPVRDERAAVRTDADIVTARQKGRAVATGLGFSAGDATLIATAISELARNLVQYANGGEVLIRSVEDGPRLGIVIQVSDDGPGIADVALALQDGFSTSGRLGLGLPGVQRLMDELEIRSTPGEGTTVTARKWKP